MVRPEDLATLLLTPIGIVRTPHSEKVDAPRQPQVASDVYGTVELRADMNLEHALEDIGTWSHLWLIFGFDRNTNWRPKVLPPRSSEKRGVFATRAPHRPNPLGLSVVALDSVEGLKLYVHGLDILDGSPVYDIKPYVAYSDAVIDASRGWMGAPPDPIPVQHVTFTENATEKLSFLEGHGVLLRSPVTRALSLGSNPSAYRRIRAMGSHSVLAHKEWRIDFRTDGDNVVVDDVRSGFRDAEFARGSVPDVHQVFAKRFGADRG